MRKIISIVLLLLLVSVFLIDAKNIKTLELTSEKPLASQLTPEFADVDSLILVGVLQDEDNHNSAVFHWKEGIYNC